MSRLLFSSYGARFNDFDLMHKIVDATRELRGGIELAVFSKNSRFPDHILDLMEEVVPFKDTYITLHGPYYEVEAASEYGSPENDYFFKSYKQAFGVYHALGAHSMVVHTNQFAFDEAERERLRGYSLETMKKLATMAEDAEVNLLIENVGEPAHGNVMYSQEDFINLFSLLPKSVGALIDIGHAIVNGWDIFAVIDALGTRIRGYHIHNNDGTRDQHLPVFHPGLKYSKKEMVRLLKYMEEKTPNSEWILEYAPGDYVTPEGLLREMREIVNCISG